MEFLECSRNERYLTKMLSFACAFLSLVIFILIGILASEPKASPPSCQSGSPSQLVSARVVEISTSTGEERKEAYNKTGKMQETLLEADDVLTGEENTTGTGRRETFTNTEDIQQVEKYEADNRSMPEETHNSKEGKKAIVSNTANRQLPDNEEESACAPKDVYISWSKIRSYLVKYIGHKIPNVFEGSKMKVRRCIYWTSPCGFGNDICLISKESYAIGNVTLKKGGKIFGYYKLLIAEHSECECSNNTAMIDQIDSPFEIPPIYDAEMVKLNETS